MLGPKGARSQGQSPGLGPEPKSGPGAPRGCRRARPTPICPPQAKNALTKIPEGTDEEQRNQHQTTVDAFQAAQALDWSKVDSVTASFASIKKNIETLENMGWTVCEFVKVIVGKRFAQQLHHGGRRGEWAIACQLLAADGDGTVWSSSEPAFRYGNSLSYGSESLAEFKMLIQKWPTAVFSGVGSPGPGPLSRPWARAPSPSEPRAPGPGPLNPGPWAPVPGPIFRWTGGLLGVM